MKTFEDICNAYKSSRSKYFKYHKESIEFAREMLKSLSDNLGIPNEQIKLVPADDDGKPGTEYGIAGALHLDDDTFWHLGAIITFYEAPTLYPHQPLKFVFQFKNDDDAYILSIDDKKKFRIKDLNFDEYNEYVGKSLCEYFENGLLRFLEKGSCEVTRKIGFK